MTEKKQWGGALHLRLAPETLADLHLIAALQDTTAEALATAWITYRTAVVGQEKGIGMENCIDAPCGCPDCDDVAQPGHFACSSSPQWLLDAEKRNEVVRAYVDGAWRWIQVQKKP
jgi:hypothetical protein